jgi:2-polyprenyl-6-methoxyphenol hydroxylase-like FAD-dependent oxidoreductase
VTAAEEQVMRVLVIGGGIGGLCLAHGLRGANIDVEVYERTAARADWLQGYRIHLNPDGCRALHDCLPAPAWARFDATAGDAGGTFRFYDQRLRTLAVLGEEVRGGERGDPVVRHRSVSRIRLREVLLHGLDGVVRHGREFVGYERIAGGGQRAHFADGSSADGDLLIGADGSNSRVRGQYLPELSRLDIGVFNVAGRYPLTARSAAGLPSELTSGSGYVLTPRSDAMFVSAWRAPERTAEQAPEWAPRQAPEGASELAPEQSPEGAPRSAPDGIDGIDAEDYVLWAYAAARSRFPADVEQWAGSALRDLVLARTDGWAPALRRLVAECDPATVAPVVLRSMPTLYPWPASTVTLLGDAIHNMSPMAGIGANTALRDAGLLRGALIEVAGGRRDLVDAVAGYEREMRGYANRAIGMSLSNAERAASDARLPRLAFRTVLRVAQAVPPLKRALFAGQGT